MRLAAAKSLLAGHHSAPFGGMPGGGGGAGGRGGRNGGGAGATNGGANLQAARQFFLSLFAGDSQGFGRAGAGGSGGKGSSRRGGGGGGARTREGEWACKCGYPNRAFRQKCNACGCARPAGGPQPERGSKGGGARAGMQTGGAPVGISGKGNSRAVSEDRRWGSGGPVGAGGARPMLGRIGGMASVDSAVPKGASGKAGQRSGGPTSQAGGDGGKGAAVRTTDDGEGWRPPAGSGGGSCAPEQRATKGSHLGAWAKPLRVVDDEGYTLVQPRRTWQTGGAAGAAEGSNAAAEHAPRQSLGGASTRPRWSDEESDDEMHLADDHEAEELDEEAENGGDEPDPKRLRAKFEALARAVRDMERRAKGNAEDPAVLALKSARDDAEQEWRRAKSPAPLSTRMSRAQAKLDRAGATLARARVAVDEFDEWVETQRAALVQRMHEADSWYRWRQQQLGSLHEEAGEMANGKPGRDSVAAAHGEAISERIASEWLPELQALMEHLQGNPEVEERLASMAASMHCAGQELSAARAEAVEAYDIAGDDDWDQRWGEHAEQPHLAGKGCTVAQNATPKGGPATWRSEGSGRWSRATAAQGKGPAATDAPEGMHDSAGNNGTADAMAAAAAAAASDAARAPGNGNKRGAEETAEDKGAMRQRTDTDQRDDADRRRAAELLQRQQEAIAAQQASHEAGEGGFGSASAQAVAAQQFIADACRAVAQARKRGIDPRTDGKELVELTPMELRRWISDHLGDEADWA